MTEKIWMNFEECVLDIDARPWKYAPGSEVQWSDDFSLVDGGLDGNCLREQEIDSLTLANDPEFGGMTDDGTKLHATLSRIFEYDLFEHEGDDRYLVLMQEIKRGVASGEFICSRVLCYGEDRLVDIKIVPNAIFLSHSSNND